MSQIISFAIPVFIALSAIEFIYGMLNGRNTYRLNDTISSLSQGLLSQVVAACTPLFQIGLYRIVYHYHLVHGHFWGSGYGVVFAIVIYDFCDYWLHRISHECNFFWAAHVVHHQSQYFNFSTALRQESAYPILGCVFFFPMALLGINPEIYGVAALAVLLYQFWVHTEHIGKLGWFDRIFTSPSNHRVHHAINEQYIDKNYGAILIIWDRLFGTFKREDEVCIYGTLTPLNSWNPFRALSFVFVDMAKKMINADCWADRVRYLYKYPGWLPVSCAGDGATVPVNAKFDTRISQDQLNVAVLFFLLASALTFGLMWHEDEMSLINAYLFAVLIAGCLWAAGEMLSGKAFRAVRL